MKNTLCPYTTLPVSEIETNREHIVPDALGGPNGFAVKAHAQANAEYGRTIDSRLIHAPLITIKAAALGLTTRSGAAEFRARGTLAADGSPVDIQLSQEGAEFRSRAPVVKDPITGEMIGVRGFGHAAQAELERVASDLKRKGYDLIPGKSIALDPTVGMRLAHAPIAIAHGLGKVAYLATVWTLGDDFIGAQGASVYRAWVNSEPTNAGLHSSGLKLLPTTGFGEEFKHLPEHCHILTCLTSDGQVATTVRLFNSDCFTFGSVVDVPELSVAPPSVRVIVINALAKSFDETTYLV